METELAKAQRLLLEQGNELTTLKAKLSVAEKCVETLRKSVCTCDYGHDGRLPNRIGPMCPRCVAITNYDKLKGETK